MNAWLTLANLIGSGVLAFIGSLVGSYVASKRATWQAEREYDREHGDNDQDGR